MILKNIFGKTIEAAKKTALQMYGDDFLVLESFEGNGSDKQAKITIFKDGGDKGQAPRRTPEKVSSQSDASGQGVEFVRTTPKGTTRLDSLRKYAAEQMLNGKDPSPARLLDTTAENEGNFVHAGAENSTSTTYDRRVAARPLRIKKRKAPSDDVAVLDEEEGSQDRSFIEHLQQQKFEAELQKPEVIKKKAPTAREEQREINALHKRFDKLEALLDSALISANLDYASHPAFQQLVQTGINTTTVAGWFSEIVAQGIDPFEMNEPFMNKLAGIIRNSLGDSPTSDPEKFMLFAGPSGAGKTNLIMKLCMHHELLEDKQVAVISVFPQEKINQPYYTILEPFCADQEIPFYKVRSGVELTQIVEELKQFDHVLIDTPAVSTEKENAFREYWKIRQILTPLTPLEVHYVVNASSNRFYFKNSSAKHHPMQPDYVAFTHLDEVSQWGPVIPFMKNMGCNARYVSLGENPAQLSEFNPQWFAQKVIQDR